MEILIGCGLALAVSLFANRVGLDRDRAFYSTVTIVVASYYALFAVMGGSGDALLAELVPIAGFVLVAALGFRFGSWLLVAGLAAHGAFDLLHGHVIANPGVPVWWPLFCLAYDVTAAGALAVLLVRRERVARKALPVAA